MCVLIRGCVCVCVLTNIFIIFFHNARVLGECFLPVFVCLCCWMQISESPMQNAFQIPSPLRSALPLPECSAARQTGKEYGQCVVVGDWLCYWPTIYSLTSCFPLCLSPPSLQERFVCLSLRIVVYVNMSPPPPLPVHHIVRLLLWSFSCHLSLVFLSPSFCAECIFISLWIFFWALCFVTGVTAALSRSCWTRIQEDETILN